MSDGTLARQAEGKEKFGLPQNIYVEGSHFLRHCRRIMFPMTLLKDHVFYDIVEGSRFLRHCRRIAFPATLSKDHVSYDIVEGSRFLRHCRRIACPTSLSKEHFSYDIVEGYPGNAPTHDRPKSCSNEAF